MTEKAERYARLDRQLLQLGPITLYFQRHVLEEAIAWFSQQNDEVVTLNCHEWKSPQDCLTGIGQQLGFPETFQGRSLDAFNDWLGDIARPHRQGTVLVFLHYESLTVRFPQFAQQVLDIIADCSYQLLLDSYRFLALAQSDDPTLSFQAVGGHGVHWNPREAIKKNRGL